MTRRDKARRKRKQIGDVDGAKKVRRGEKDEEAQLEDSILLPTREAAANQLLIALRRTQMALIEGDVGSGKTFLAQHLARQLGLPLRVMQMGEDLDAKSLYGSYSCAEVAGHFKWKASPFHSWLSEAGLIVMEDMDSASPDVICELLRVAENRRVALPSGEEMTLHPRALLLATISGSSKQKGLQSAVAVRVRLHALSEREQSRLASSLFPRIAHLAPTFSKLFTALQTLPAHANSRTLTSTDYLRGMSRVARMEEVGVSESLLLELLDCWCMSEKAGRAVELGEKVAAALSLSPHQLHSALAVRHPSLHIQEDSLLVGRIRLPRREQLSKGSRLARSRGCMQLLERLAAVVKAREAALLVGEAGVGKTSIVQALADSLGHPLTVVNLGPHSDGDDLIAGFKPTTYAQLMQSYTVDFVNHFNKSFNEHKNIAYLQNLERCLKNGRYNDYLTVAEDTARRVLMKKRCPEWASLLVRARRLRSSLNGGATPFSHSRGVVAAAVEEGHWLLLDEVNLATPECLDALMHAVCASPHDDFRLFACMNPASDAGKRPLPHGVRSRFTEFAVEESDDITEISHFVSAYLPSASPSLLTSISNFYVDARKSFPHTFSLRALSRALLVTAEAPFESEARNMNEAFSMAFLSTLEPADKDKMRSKLAIAFPCSRGGGMKTDERMAVLVEGYAVEKGCLTPSHDNSYVMTPTVKSNLAELSRIVSCGRLPVLLEGETSAGKTSIVAHLAALSGNTLLRINNHEHTDIHEYMGSYVADAEGRLVFREGPLVQAVRQGHWIILDELNLAPTDVIEALNRLLDDNRELLVAEQNCVLRAHPRFRLFATQNPAGGYAGRKRLSRALLSRFAVLLFPQLPLSELAEMVVARCRVAPTAAALMLKVLAALRLRRSLSGLFSSRDGLMTLRDVFRWARRLSSDAGDDWRAALLHHGYFLLGGRCRNEKDEEAVVEVLQKELKGKIERDSLFAENSPYFPRHLQLHCLVLTQSMRRMLVLAWQAWQRNEALLVVGETGEGKTRLAECLGEGNLLSINCHERTETSDLLGRLRPNSTGGFVWQDGVVVAAMREGRPLLMDEISLAEDSVLERLNPLFEEHRSMLLSDAGADSVQVAAADGFNIIATMNPGGDYGKKELSKALRNRFTEMWTTSYFSESELCSVFMRYLPASVAASSDSVSAAKTVVKWIARFSSTFAHVFRVSPSLRDVVACSQLYSSLFEQTAMQNGQRLLHTLSATFLDALPSHSTRFSCDTTRVQQQAIQMLWDILGRSETDERGSLCVTASANGLSVGGLSLPAGPLPPSSPSAFSLSAPTCASNFYRILRALLIKKPILLEGSPGCGKSSTVMALAQLAGYPITRLNLSEQTDLSDLFGSDMPVVDEEGKISFRWEDGPVLAAIKRGEWILLDEMNLASQSILEGLNACFDHRRVLYIAELAKEFVIPDGSQCRFFACQNPSVQGGNRRALPKSFINRFTNIYIDDLKEEDQLCILREGEGSWLSEEKMRGLVRVNAALSAEIWSGGPFQFNLRDMLRCLRLAKQTSDLSFSLYIVYLSRLRSSLDLARARSLVKQHLNLHPQPRPSLLSIDDIFLRIGPITIPRVCTRSVSEECRLLGSQCEAVQAVAAAASLGWLSLLVGPRCSGRRSIVATLAQLTGRTLHVLPLSADTDAAQLIGSYEQRVDEGAMGRSIASVSSLLSPFVSHRQLQLLQQCEDALQLEKDVELLLASSAVPSEVASRVEVVIARATRSDMSFEWVDSAFVRAFTQGHWLLLENVNVCSSAVLDRLNSCLESEGTLVVSERSSGFHAIQPHPDFRIFLSMDANEGEISRAMRNRSLEVYLREDMRWATKNHDVRAVLSTLAGRDVSCQMAASLEGESAQRMVHAGVMLSEMEEEDTARVMERSLSLESPSPLPLPQPLSLVAESGSRSEWLLSCWEAAAEGEGQPLPLLPFLAASPFILTHSSWQHAFGDQGREMVARCFSPIKKFFSSVTHPIDCRFHGSFSLENADMCDRLCREAVLEWSRQRAISLECEAESALALHSSLSHYELSSHELYMDGMEKVDKLDTALIGLFSPSNSSRVQCEERELISFCLSVLSVLRSLRRRLERRGGSAGMAVAVEMAPPLPLSHWLLPSPQVAAFLLFYSEHRLVDPFIDEQSSSLFTHQLQLLIHDIKEAEGDISLGISLPVEVTDKSFFLLYSLSSVVRDGSGWQRVVSTLSWRRPESQRKTLLPVLLAERVGDGCASRLSRQSPLSLALCSLWDALSFDCSHHSLSVRDLSRLSLDSALDSLWRLAPNSAAISDAIRREREMLGEEDAVSLLARAVDELGMCLPPLHCMDPVIMGEERLALLQHQLSTIQSLLSTLSHWRATTCASLPEADENSPHPVICSLFSLRQKLQSEIEQLDNSFHSCYRGEAKQLRSLVVEMQSMYGVSVQLLNGLQSERWQQQSTHSLSITAAQVDSFLVSSLNFIHGCGLRYASLVDIFLPFWSGLWLARLAAFELSSQLQQRLRWLQLTASHSLPPRLSQPRRSWLGAEWPELRVWASRAGSPLPLNLQAALARHSLSQQPSLLLLTWTLEQWNKWYERHVARAAEKEFEYRNKTMEDKEDAERQYFFEREDERADSVLCDEDLSELVLAPLQSPTPPFHPKQGQLVAAAAWLARLAAAIGAPQTVQWETAAFDAALSVLRHAKTEQPIDVYREASREGLRIAAEALHALIQAVEEQRKLWPEVASLPLIVDAVTAFMQAPLSSSQMKMARMLESVLEESEQWERVASREHSLERWLCPLQQLLLQWKQAEVRCWEGLLSRVEEEARLAARLVAAPLFLALLSPHTHSHSLLAMAAKWITDGSLLDFPERIHSLRLLARWSTVAGEHELAARLGSLSAYFSQFECRVAEKLTAVRKPIQNALADFALFAKYRDLNLENIKASSQKNHAQLFKMVKKYRDEASTLVSALLDGLLPMETLISLSDPLPINMPEGGMGRAEKAAVIAKQCLERQRERKGPAVLVELAEKMEETRRELEEKIIYDGEEELKEKQQGRARNRRQRLVALLLKQAQQLGLSARKSKASREELSEQCISALPEGNEEWLILTRATAAARNSIHRAALTPNEQLTPSLRATILGMIDYGMEWLLESAKELREGKEKRERLRLTLHALRTAVSNAKSGRGLRHMEMAAATAAAQETVERMQQVVAGMQLRLQHTPNKSAEGEEAALARLSLLDSESAALSPLRDSLSRLHSLCQHLQHTLHGLTKSAVSGVFPVEESFALLRVIWEYAESLESEAKDMEAWFCGESRELIAASLSLRHIFKNMEGTENAEEVEMEIIPCLLFVQGAYNGIEEKEGERQLLLSLTDSRRSLRLSGKLLEWAEETAAALREGAKGGKGSEEAADCLAVAHALMQELVAAGERDTHSVAVLTMRLAQIGVQLMQSGYVNTIPKEEKATGEGKEGKEDGGEGAGMGEGRGSKDVTEEMEETGQLEGLKGDEEEDAGEEKRGDNERPIEMEEDFPEELQDVDRGEAEGEEGEEEDEGEPPMDDVKGDVDEKDNEELDPKLWDEKEKEGEQDKQMDQDNRGAEDKTGDMAAKEDETVGSEEKDKEGDEGAGQEDEHVENVDEREREEDNGQEGEAEQDEKKEDAKDAEDDAHIDMEGEVEEGDNEDDEEKKEDDVMEVEEKQEDTTQQPENEAAENVEEKEEDAVEEQGKSLEDEIEGGSGGQKEEQKSEGGGRKDDEEKDDTQDTANQQINAASKKDKRGKEGDAPMEAEAVVEEEIGEKEEEKKETERNVVEREEEMEVDAEEERVSGQEDMEGQQREEAAAGEKEMAGAGSLQEAKESRKLKKEDDKRKADMAALHETMERAAQANESAEEELQQSTIHLSPLDMLGLAERVTREWLLGGEEKVKESSGKKEEKEEAALLWQTIAPSVNLLAAELADRLRLILEPRRATRMQGDYRTGKRLNMRRLITYIASEYRKDAIWMRRTKKAERDYQVMLAVDDSASMRENGMQKVTCEGVCIVEEALRRVDAGQMSVVRFGEKVEEIVAFGERGADMGPLLLSSLSFSQSSTDLSCLLRTASSLLASARSPTSEQLLIILSDGRGALAGGSAHLRSSLAALHGVTVLFLILDCGSKSINDHSVASFDGGSVSVVPYLSLFPFPLYVLVKSIAEVPSVLAEALRQWIQLGAVDV